ncbi:hypothetical protein DFP73DRAFT_592094 [Morchella snyderi]|nr:hypothetical protein DFP73DRAFT_592094 [Morchella snyderi]
MSFSGSPSPPPNSSHQDTAPTSPSFAYQDTYLRPQQYSTFTPHDDNANTIYANQSPSSPLSLYQPPVLDICPQLLASALPTEQAFRLPNFELDIYQAASDQHSEHSPGSTKTDFVDPCFLETFRQSSPAQDLPHNEVPGNGIDPIEPDAQTENLTRSSQAFSSLPGFLDIPQRNKYGKYDCFESCELYRNQKNGFLRRSNLLTHLRNCHAQMIPIKRRPMRAGLS